MTTKGQGVAFSDSLVKLLWSAKKRRGLLEQLQLKLLKRLVNDSRSELSRRQQPYLSQQFKK